MLSTHMARTKVTKRVLTGPNLHAQTLETQFLRVRLYGESS